MLVNNLSELFNKMILEARGKPILTMMETIRTKIMLLFVKKKEEADKWKGILCPKIKQKLDVNIKYSLRCVPSHAGGDKYQVECGPGSQHVVDLVQTVIHIKNEFLETYVQTWYTKQTQLQIYSNLVSPVKGPKQWASLSNMLPILPIPLRRPPGSPTKVRTKEPDKPQTTERFSKRGVEMRFKDIELMSEPSNRLPQVSKRVPQLNKVPQLSYLLSQLSRSCPKTKAPIKEKINHNHCPLLDGCLLLKSHP
ncbi:hypothetical protein GOBAR_AA33628 [Gossypium barbadense]|uniref:Uncharacterized protein n=1 Tax=Gossypium barbadense TaxID=3634 RepID=A0A2P5W7N1_GOSBA|nr:hypothetical protein GOBAR_AA33628 [Gossypium barbadense]